MRSLSYYIIGLILGLSLIISVGYYYAEVHDERRVIEIQELAQNTDARHVIGSLLAGEAERLSSVGRSMKEREDLQVDLAVSAVTDASPGSLKHDLDALVRDLRLDIAIATDAGGAVLYDSGGRAPRGERLDMPGIATVPGGDEATVVSRTVYGWAILVMEPVFLAGEPVGAVVIGTRIDNALADRLARVSNVSLALASPDEIVASSGARTLAEEVDWETIRAALTNDKVLRAPLRKAGKAAYYSPLELLGREFALVMEFDTAEIERFHRERRERHAVIFLIILAGTLGLGTVLTLRLVRPLKLLRLKAEETVREVTGREIPRQEGDEVRSLVRSFGLMVSALGEHIAERARAEERIRQSYLLTHEILERAPYGIILVDSACMIEYVNAAMLAISGANQSEVIGSDICALPTYSAIGMDEKIRAAIAGVPFATAPIEYTSHFGRRTTVRRFIGLPFSEEGEHKALLFVEDLTELKKAENAVLQQRQDWEDTFNSINEMITIHDSDYTILHANRAAREGLGIDPRSGEAPKCFRQFHGGDAVHEKCAGRECLNSGAHSSFEFFEPHLGQHIEVRAIPRLDKDNNVTGIIHLARDISDRKRAEERIERQVERLRALRTIDRAINASLDLGVTLDVLIDQVMYQLHVDAAAVLLVTPEDKGLIHAASKGFRTSRIGDVSLRLGQGLAGMTAAGRVPLRIPDLMDEGSMFASYRFADSYFVRDEDFRAYYATPLLAKGSVIGVLELFHRAPLNPDQDWLEFLDALSGQVAIAIDNARMFEGLERSRDELVMAYDTTIEGWAKALDYRDRETEGHSRRVTELTVRIARHMGIPDRDIVHVRRGALLHDIGKMGIPDEILLKKGRLTEWEMDVMKRHPVIAFELLGPIRFLRDAVDIPYRHHEKWDGTGYPQGLRGEEIPLAARIFSVVDVWDALLSDRPYRGAWPRETVIDYLREQAGAHFDPDVVHIFLGSFARR
jgi:putative nucleotidyltransferase with HDIG domain/PAS domain S-box-containing protein